MLPWYRQHDYRGNLTETEKRQLDHLRARPNHPATTSDDLPKEVQDYIGNLEIQLYDMKQETAAGRAIVLSFFGAVSLYTAYFGPPSTTWASVIGPVLIVAPWLYYRYEWKKNADSFLPEDPLTPHNTTDEGILVEWERNYVAQHLRKRD